MELLVLVLILLATTNCLVKLSFWRWWQVALFSALCGAFVLWAWPLAIEQTKTQLADYLHSPVALQNMAVLLTLESYICFGFCTCFLNGRFGRKRQPLWIRLLWAYPSLLIFPILFYTLTQAIFALPGVPFTQVTWVVAACVALLLPPLSIGIRRLLPEQELRAEAHFLLSLLVCGLGLLSTEDGQTVYEAATISFDARPLLVALALFAALFALGLMRDRLKWPLRAQRRARSKAR